MRCSNKPSIKNERVGKREFIEEIVISRNCEKNGANRFSNPLSPSTKGKVELAKTKFAYEPAFCLNEDQAMLTFIAAVNFDLRPS